MQPAILSCPQLGRRDIAIFQHAVVICLSTRKEAVVKWTSLSILVLLSLLLIIPNSEGQCPEGLTYAGLLEGEGSFGHNFNGTRELLLPPYTKIDRSYRQTQLKAFGGGSDARSPMLSSDIPGGLYVVPTGTEDHEKGWSVHSPYFRPSVADDQDRVKQWAFGLTLYCTVGSGETDRLVGGCNVKVLVCFKAAVGQDR